MGSYLWQLQVLETSDPKDGSLFVTAAGAGDLRSDRWVLTCDRYRCWRPQIWQMGSYLWQLQVLETSDPTHGFLPMTAAGTGDLRSDRWALTCDSCRCWRPQIQQMGSYLWQIQVLETSDPTDGLLPVTAAGAGDLRSNRWVLTCDSCRCWRPQIQQMGSYWGCLVQLGSRSTDVQCRPGWGRIPWTVAGSLRKTVTKCETAVKQVEHSKINVRLLHS